MNQYQITVRGGKRFKVEARDVISAANKWNYGTPSGDKYTRWDILKVEIIGSGKANTTRKISNRKQRNRK